MMEQAIGPDGVLLEYDHALYDAQAWAREYGIAVVIHVRGEPNVSRDDYNSIAGRPSDSVTLTLNAASVEYQPTRYKLEKAGLREECDATVWVAMQDLTDNGLAFDDLEVKRMTVDLQAIPGESNGNRYEIREKSRAGAFGPGFVYVTLGLRRG